MRGLLLLGIVGVFRRAIRIHCSLVLVSFRQKGFEGECLEQSK
jgi:hypothetical protein